MFSSPAHAQAPRNVEVSPQVTPVSDVPIETLQYSNGKVQVRFGDELYELSMSRLDAIYEAIEQDELRSKKETTPAERREYFKLEQRLND